MGKLRLELKNKPVVDSKRYDELLSILQEAQNAAGEHEIFWDLEGSENATLARKEFNYVAEKEQIGVSIRQQRNTRSLKFKFSEEPKKPARMPAEDARKRIPHRAGCGRTPLEQG